MRVANGSKVSFQKVKDKGADQTAQMRSLDRAFVVLKPPKTAFQASMSIWDPVIFITYTRDTHNINFINYNNVLEHIYGIQNKCYGRHMIHTLYI